MPIRGFAASHLNGRDFGNVVEVESRSDNINKQTKAA
jgi:hypothetical protein